MGKKVWVSFSSGKDSMLCLDYLLRDDTYAVEGLFITYNEENNRVSMHGVAIDLVQAQAKQLNLPLKLIPIPGKVSHKAYAEIMTNFLLQLKADGISTVAFGDIFLEDLKQYREENLLSVGMEAIFPIWGIPTHQIIQEIKERGIKTLMVAINAQKLTESFLGQTISPDLVKTFPKDVDVCGENGEFHTYVYDSPFFDKSIALCHGDIVTKYYTHNQEKYAYKFIDLKLQA